MWEGRVSLRWEITVLSVCRSVCLSVGRSVSRSVSRNQSVGKQSVRKEEKNVFRQLMRFVIIMRRREAKGSINTGRCQDTRVSQSTPPQYNLEHKYVYKLGILYTNVLSSLAYLTFH